MSLLSEQQVLRLAMSPLFVIYAVGSARYSPAEISRRHIIRAIEYGLSSEREGGEGIFELLKMNLHEFFAKIPREFPEDFVETCFQEIQAVRSVLRETGLPPEMIADFKESLYRLARYVAGGSVFGSEVPDSAMAARAEKIRATLD